VVEFLNDATNFYWHNLSVPRHDPVSSKELTYQLHNQMRDADAFLIIAGMYAVHSDWIEYEINFARRIGRPIIGIDTWGSTRTTLAIQNAAKEIVGWTGASIVSAIRRWALPSGNAPTLARIIASKGLRPR